MTVPLFLALALALAAAAHLMGLRLFRRYPVLSAFAAGVLCTLLVVSMTRASAPRPAQEPAPVPDRMGFEHGGRVPAPSVTPGLAPAPGWSPVTPSPNPNGTRPAGDGASPDRNILRGTASWFRSPVDTSAAGPDLRAALGRGWRGTFVRVTGPAGTAVVQLGDWMRRDRLIDLDDGAFRRVCGPLRLGVCRVRVVALGAIALPETDAP